MENLELKASDKNKPVVVGVTTWDYDRIMALGKMYLGELTFEQCYWQSNNLFSMIITAISSERGDWIDMCFFVRILPPIFSHSEFRNPMSKERYEVFLDLYRNYLLEFPRVEPKVRTCLLL